MALTMTFRMSALAAFVLATLPVAGHGQTPAQQQPTFRASSDLVLIDTQVVGRDGSPITGLKADQFEVSIDGRKRPVLSAEFSGASIGTSTSAAPSAPTTTGAPATTPTQDGRVVVIGVDQGSFPTSTRASAKEAATRILDRVSPNDYVGLIAFPGNTEIAPTRDRTAVRAAIGRINGLRMESLSTRFNISATEALQLRARTSMATTEVVDRECRREPGQACTQEVINVGTSIADVLEQQAAMSLSGLRGVVDAMGSLPGRKTLIVVSAGLPMSNQPGARLNIDNETARIALRAEAVNINLYVFYMNVHFLTYFSPQYGKINHSIFDDVFLFGTGLEKFADAGGGAFFQIEVDPNPFVDRVMRETSAGYVLGVQAEPGMRDGKEHTIRVTVKQKNTSVRYRHVVTIPRGGL